MAVEEDPQMHNVQFYVEVTLVLVLVLVYSDDDSVVYWSGA